MEVILAAIDFSKATKLVLDAVGVLARMAPSRVIIAYALQPSILPELLPSTIEEFNRGEEKAASERLEQVRRGLENDGLPAEARLLIGQAGPKIIEEAKASHATFLVIGSQGHGSLRQLLVGSTTVHLLRHGPCPVLVVPLSAYGAYEDPALAKTATT